MQKTTHDTANPGSEDSTGLQTTKPARAAIIPLMPWEIAEKLLPIANGQAVSVEFASDAQFQAWIVANGIPVDEDGIPDWSFDDRCGVIMHALSFGVPLAFVDEKNAETIPNNSEKELSEELLETPKPASQAEGA